MAVQLNHTIVWCRDREASAAFYTDILGLPDAPVWGPFRVVDVSNGVELAFHPVDGEISSQHYAFLVTEEEFDGILGRIQERELTIWADPMLSEVGELNHDDGGRGVYWMDPDGHLLEAITVPYGGWDHKP